MKKILIHALLPLQILMALLIGCKTGPHLYRMSVTPGPDLASQLDPSGKAVTFEEQGIWGALMPLPFASIDFPVDVDPRWDFANPFQGLYAEYKKPIAFYLILENRSDVAISFNPSASFSLLLEGWPLFPIEYDDLYQALYDTPGGSRRLEGMRKMLLRSYVTLRPGEHIRGLLLFKRPDPGVRQAKELTFRIQRIFTGKGEVDFLLPFRITMKKVTPLTP